ncbi:BAG family molecular chaperone regulator 1-like isoform X2 [Gigantopelta aegis]|uniref:BAG family molecular chaperone regulator 1-like isoform X2 n=1 Tax=Gigantopelta aegis TaxID=1735272 RepID=UPI001B88D8C7|nr:BAG family molecular chaperone regulator 1-like isoform X2 [Gigantopelta aegis]
MANDSVEGLKLQLVYGSTKHQLNLQLPENDDVLTVARLSDAVADLTQVPRKQQKLIFKGRSLKNPDDSLTSLGLKQGSKVMLLGKKLDPDDAGDVMKMKSASQDLDKLRERLTEISTRLDGIDKGFLDEDKKESSLREISRQLSVLTESLMKQLESLDALRFDDDNKVARTRRKNLVDNIQHDVCMAVHWT